MERKIEEKLNGWLSTKYALMVFGARQVGKTYIIKDFLEKNFDKYYYLNLHENKDAIEAIIKAKDVDEFFLILTSLNNKVDIKDGTPIFIDEIQEYYTYIAQHKEIKNYFDIISETKYIVEAKNNKIALSGSLLRLEMDNLVTNPVGYLLPLELYPMDFEEFLWANNISKELIEIAKESFINKTLVPNYIHNQFLNLYRKYILVGGMPQAVFEFVNKNSFLAVENAHKTIEYFIVSDITKYANDNEKLKIKEIYSLIPTELSNPSRKFIFSDIQNKNKNNNEILSFSWLKNAGITIPTYIASEPSIPLIMYSKRNQLKLFHEDVGILTYLMFDYETKSKIY